MDRRTGWVLVVILILVLGLGTVVCGSGYWLWRTLKPASSTGWSEVTVEPTLPPLTTPEVQPVPATPPPSWGEALQGVGLSDTLRTLYQQAAPGVVSILTYGPDGDGQGSGFVYNKDGYMVTNYHVVNGAEQIEVDFLSGAKVWAELVGTDLDSDLAVIKVDVPSAELHPLPLGDSDDVQVGDLVVAIGNPFGLRGTMTLGIVSAKGRTLASERESGMGGFFSTGDVIQTDAPINPGNSGGPLLNLRGEVVGVNRAIRTTGVTLFGEPVNSGIGFAVPVNIIKKVVPVLIRGESYDYPYIGISSVDQLSLKDIERLGLPQTTGVYIVEVVPGSPADKAGLRGASEEPANPHEIPKGGDLIVALDGHPIRDFGDLMYDLMYNKRPGDTVVFTVLRDGHEVQVKVKLGSRK